MTDDDGVVLDQFALKGVELAQLCTAHGEMLEQMNLVHCERCDTWLPGEQAVEHDLDFYCPECDDARRAARRRAGRTEVPEQ